LTHHPHPDSNTKILERKESVLRGRSGEGQGQDEKALQEIQVRHEARIREAISVADRITLMARNRVSRQETCCKNRVSEPHGAITVRQHGGTYNSLVGMNQKEEKEREEIQQTISVLSLS
jgi:hypothetical protein